MASTVPVNEATAQQLSALLNLTPMEAQRVIAARPFATAAEFAQSLPPRVARTGPPLDLPKLDINQTSEDDLVRLAGVSTEVARAILAGRPYYVMLELRHVPVVDAAIFDRLVLLFTTADFSYTDKLTGQTVQLTPDPSQVLVRARVGQSESANNLAGALKLHRQSRPRSGDDYQVFDVPETETGTDVLAQLKRSPAVQQVSPGFQDAQGNPRYLDPGFCVVQFAADVPEQRQEAIIAALGLEVAERHRTAGLLTLRLPQASDDPGALFRALAGLNSSPEVKFAEPAYVAVNDLEWPHDGRAETTRQGETGAGQSDIEAASVVWNLSLIRAPQAWGVGMGSEDVIIAVVDSGVDEAHPALQDAILPRGPDDDWNFADDGTPAPTDEEGHGTFIAGLLVGNGALDVRGISPGCRLLPLKVPVSGSSLSYARRRDGILYALDYVPAGKRLIINLSWKTTGDIALIRDAVATAVARNAVVVCSAGNWPDREDQPHYPSDYPSVMSVGGIGPDRRRAAYSFYGRRVDVAAPGGNGGDDPAQNLRSAAPGGTTQTDFGTSFAAPHVAGIAGLILSQDPTLASAQVEQTIEATATPVVDDGLGHGLVDAAAAVAATIGSLQSPPGQSPASALDAVNGDDLETLVARFGLSRITARLLIAHRPFSRIEDIRGTLGLTDDQYANIAGSPPASGNGTAVTASKVNANLATLEQLDAIPGMPVFTARVIVARRPFRSLDGLTTISGMTEAVLQDLTLG